MPRKRTANRERAYKLYLDGRTYREIGIELGVSKQRAQQLIRPPQTVYDAVVERDKGRCQSCGEVPRRGQGHVHHKSCECGDFNDPSLLVYVCQPCHRRMHKSPIPTSLVDLEFTTVVNYVVTEKELIDKLRSFAHEHTFRGMAESLGVSTGTINDAICKRRVPSEKLLTALGLRRKTIWVPIE